MQGTYYTRARKTRNHIKHAEHERYMGQDTMVRGHVRQSIEHILHLELHKVFLKVGQTESHGPKKILFCVMRT